MGYLLNKIKNAKQGSIALILVIMITTITLVSSLIIALISVTDLTASYHVTESKSVATNIDACVEDALSRIASSTSVSGSYNFFTSDINCTYDISTIMAGFITVTSTASSTADLGYWQDQVVVSVNVSTTPISIETYKTSTLGFDSYDVCGDGVCTYGEDCSCSSDCGSCVCGDGVVEGDEVCDDNNEFTEGCGTGAVETAGTYCNSTCSAEVVILVDEVCDDDNTSTERCGDGIVQNGSGFCNETCSATFSLSEACDYTGARCNLSEPTAPREGAVGCGKMPLCDSDCSTCGNFCPSS